MASDPQGGPAPLEGEPRTDDDAPLPAGDGTDSANAAPVDDDAGADEARTPSGERRAGHDAVVYFHGIGEQRRHEEVSRLVDALDVHAHRATSEGDRDAGILQKIRARFEAPRDPRLGDVTYLRVVRSRRTDEGPEFSAHRFYEVYWAPATAGGRPARDVLVWLLRQTTTPVRMLASPWRSRPRLHRAVLFALWRDLQRAGTAKEGDLATLVREYSRFERPDSRRAYPRGSFGEFLAYLRARLAGKRPAVLARLERLARRWRRRWVLGELTRLVGLLSFGLTVLLGIVALAGGLLIALNWLTELGVPDYLAEQGAGSLAARLRPGWGNALLALGVLASVLGVARYVGRHLGDVQFWSTYSETDEKHAKRQEILEQGAAMLSHVLCDPRCRRVTVVGHSLGSAIAMECLLELGRYNRARQREEPLSGPVPLDKIRHLVTLGSPIDKIHYFFESHRTPHHRYVRVFDDVRGDIGEVPFAKNRKPHIHWVNVWDRADPVSGPLDSPTNGRMPWLAVDNVEVSTLPFPDPAASHSAYFRDPGVVGMLYRLIFDSWCSFDAAPRDDRGRPDYRAVLLGPGGGRRTTAWIQRAVLLTPFWLLVLVALALVGGPTAAAVAILAVLVATGGIVGAGLALNSEEGRRLLARLGSGSMKRP